MKPMRSDKARPDGNIAGSIGLAVVFFCGPGATFGQDRQSLCDQAAISAAQNSDVPVEILQAITRVETGRGQDGQILPWPWVINLDGKGYWFDDEDQAIAFADQQLGLGIENFDVGCFQINLRWHGAEFVSLADVFDPQTNARYAARFLTDLYAEKGDWAQAVAAYHSRTPALAAVYLEKLQAVMAGLAPDIETFNPTPVAAPARKNRFPLLQSGASAGAGSIVPITNAGTPLIGGVQ